MYFIHRPTSIVRSESLLMNERFKWLMTVCYLYPRPHISESSFHLAITLKEWVVAYLSGRFFHELTYSWGINSADICWEYIDWVAFITPPRGIGSLWFFVKPRRHVKSVKRYKVTKQNAKLLCKYTRYHHKTKTTVFTILSTSRVG